MALIAIEGIDGAGKRTQTECLVEALQSAGVRSTWLSFPRYGETKASEAISGYLNGVFGPLEAIPNHMPALLYAEDRYESRSLLARLRETHDVVVVDRYVASNLAYQSARVPMPRRTAFIDWLAKIEHVVNGLSQADLTILLDVPVDTSASLVARKGAREYTRQAADLHERNTAYLSRCRETYLDLCTRQYRSQWQLISCMDADGHLRSIESICAEVGNVAGSFLRQPD